jgi:flagellar hook protein FlgE
MIESLNSGLTGLEAFQNQMDVIGNNIANSNTVGFKTSRADFASTLSDTLVSTGVNPSTIGNGVSTSEVQTLFTQGQLSQTGGPNDLAISGQGFFLVKDAGGTTYATRAGNFQLDSKGNLITATGQNVQGLTSSGAQGNIQITPPSTAAAGTTVSGYTIASNGTVTGTLSDGTTFSAGQITLQNYTNPGALVSQGSNLYTGLAAAGPVATNPAVPGTSGMGTVQSGYVEMSNVDLAGEMTNLITAQRGFEASAKVVTTSDEVLQDVIGLKR